MFQLETTLLRNYILKYETSELFHIKKEKRGTNAFYDFSDIKYALLKDDSPLVLTKDNYKNYYTKDQSNVYFIQKELLEYENVDYVIRKLTIADKNLFETFHKSQSKEDKEEGMVSLEDDVVYGAIIDNKLVSVSSTWNWGETLADIGILTDPAYRKRGISKDVIKTLIRNTNKIFVYRCDKENIGSNKLAQSIGFEKRGEITTLID